MLVRWLPRCVGPAFMDKDVLPAGRARVTPIYLGRKRKQ
jgi:hypothetical protein